MPVDPEDNAPHVEDDQAPPVEETPNAITEENSADPDDPTPSVESSDAKIEGADAFLGEGHQHGNDD